MIKKLFSIIGTCFKLYGCMSEIKSESAENIDKIQAQMEKFIGSLEDDASKKLIPLIQLLQNQIKNLKK